MKSAIAVVSCAFFLGACASSPSASVPEKSEAKTVMVDANKSRQRTQSGEDVVICRNEAKIGSNIKRQRCMTQEALDAERAKTQMGLRDLQSAGPGPANN